MSKIEVESLTDPFCVYGLENKLNKINGIENLKIDFGKATVLVTSINIHNISNSTLKK